jgi:hypothetical protein
VPALDEVEEGHTGLSLVPEAGAIEQLAFERGKEALRHRVVVASPTLPMSMRHFLHPVMPTSPSSFMSRPGENIERLSIFSNEERLVMNTPMGRLLMLSLALAAAGCSHRPQAPPAGFELLAYVDTQPVLKQCHAYEVSVSTNRVFVPVRFGVTADGRVVNARARPLYRGTVITPEVAATLTAAEMAVTSCEYYPATLAGNPVAVHDMGTMFILTRQP